MREGQSFQMKKQAQKCPWLIICAENDTVLFS